MGLSGVDSLLGNGSFVTFPVLFYILIGVGKKQSRTLIRQKRIRLFMGLLMLTPFVILVLDVLGSPEVLCRYRMDTYWIFGLLCYLFIGLLYQTKVRKPAFSSFICYLAIFTVAVSILLFLYPSNCNFGWFLLPENRPFLASFQ